MPFIGNQPALSFTSFAKQDFTTSATTSYTLDNPVANANELALFINFVRQEPGSYSASGTSLTLTEATSSSDDMYCVFLGKAVQTVNPPNNSVGTSQLVDGAVTPSKQSALANPFASQLLHVRDEKANNTAAGTFTSGAWRTRELNTIKTNEITGASLSSNQITLPTGTYYIKALVPAFNVSRHQAVLYNTTDSSFDLIGTSEFVSGGTGLSRSFVNGRFTISAQKTFELQHQCETTDGGNGLGVKSTFGQVCVYAEVQIWRTA